MSVYAISDLHGRYDLYQEVKRFLKPSDKVFCLGDCGDRGPDGWKLIKAVRQDPQFRYLMGNHEHMLLGAMQEYLSGDAPTFYSIYPGAYGNMAMLLSYNGGSSTLKDWIDEGFDADWFKSLMSLPCEEVYVNHNGIKVLLSHAGYNPTKHPIGNFDLMWNRNHFHSPWLGADNELIVHGHTPCSYLVSDYGFIVEEEAHRQWESSDGAIWYADNHKIDIDVGAYFTGVTCLLDLDTFDEHYFSVK